MTDNKNLAADKYPDKKTEATSLTVAENSKDSQLKDTNSYNKKALRAQLIVYGATKFYIALASLVLSAIFLVVSLYISNENFGFYVLFTLLFLYSSAGIIRRAWKQLLIFNPKIGIVTPNRAIIMLIIPILSIFGLFFVFKGWAVSFNKATNFAPKESLTPVSEKLFTLFAWVGVVNSIISFFYFQMNIELLMIVLFVGFLIQLPLIFMVFSKMQKATDELCMLNYKAEVG